jgi:hypothetical protein
MPRVHSGKILKLHSSERRAVQAANARVAAKPVTIDEHSLGLQLRKKLIAEPAELVAGMNAFTDGKVLGGSSPCVKHWCEMSAGPGGGIDRAFRREL